jgi:hypothetical protein
MIPSWLRNLARTATGKVSGRGRRRGQRPRPSWRPVFEQFEDRLVPTQMSIPTNLSAVQGAVVSVPINVDTLNDGAFFGNTGLGGGDFMVYYNPSVFSVSSSDVGLGTISTPSRSDPSGTANGDGYSPTTIQTITFGGNTSGGTFALLFNGVSTAAITYSTIPATLQANIQAALDTTIGAGDTLVSAFSATDVLVTFEGADFGTDQPAMGADGSNLIGSSPTVSVAITAAGPNGWSAAVLDSSPGFLYVSLSNDGTGLIGGTGGGSLAVINFHVLQNAPLGGSMIDLGADSAPGGLTNPVVPADLIDDSFNTYTLTPALVDNTTLNPSYAYNGVDANDGTVTVTPAQPHFVVSAALSTFPGAPFTFTVTAENPDNSTNLGYSGTVHFTSSDTSAVLPGNATLVNGMGTFSATLATPGNQTITATDTVASTLTGNSGTIVVVGAPPHFAVIAPSIASIGSPFAFTVIAENNDNSVDAAYSGTVQFTSSDAQALLPPNTTLSGGIGYFAALLETAGNQTIVATDTTQGNIAGTSGTIAVAANTPEFIVTAPSTVTAGNALVFTVTALDANDQLATSYNGTVTFTSSDTLASLPANATLTNGMGFFAAVLRTGGNQIISATDTATSSLTGASNAIAVVVTLPHFAISVPTSTAAGTAFAFTVTAENPNNTTDTGYTGTVQFTSSDTQAVLPASMALISGIGTFSATLKTAGSQTLAATDSVNSTLTGSSAAVAVTPLAATHLAVTGPANVAAATPFAFTVTAEDPFGNAATSYNGTVGFTTTDSSATLPPTSAPPNIPANLLGNILVDDENTTTSTILEYTPSGSLVQTFTVPNAPQGDQQARGIAVDGNGNIEVYNGTFSPFLTTLNLSTGAVIANGTLAGWSTDSNPAFGGLAAYANTVFATDMVTPNNGSPNGLIQFNINNDSGTRFAETDRANFDGDYIQVTIGLNGLLYALYPGMNSGGNQIDVFDPSTLQLLQQLTLNQQLGAIAVDQFGNIFGVGTSTGQIVEFDSNGNQINDTSTPVQSFDDIAINANDQLVASFGNTIVLTDTTLSNVNSFNANTTGIGTFVTWVEPPVGAGVPVLNDGVGVFTATLRTAGNQTLSAATSSMAATSNAVVVSGPHFAVNAPSSALPNSPFAFTVTAENGNNSTNTAYTGTVHFSSSDGQAVLPANATLISGTGVFTATLKTQGNQSLAATDSTGSSFTGTSNTISVQSAGQLHFVVNAPGTTTAGNPFIVVVTAENQFNSPVTTYNGTVRFSSSDSQALVSAPLVPFANGVGFFAATLKTAGNQTITAFDATTSSMTGTSNVITVSAAAATHFAVTAVLPSYQGVPTGPTSFATTGVPLSFTVSALDPFNNIAPTYTGTVQFSSSDTAAGVVLPANSTLTSGVGSFSATLMTPGNQTLTATDTVHSSGSNAIAGVSSAIVTRGLVVTSFTPAPDGFTITFNKPFKPSTVNLYTTGSLPDAAILATTNSQVSVRGSLLINATDTSITFVKTAAVAATSAFNPISGLLAAGNYTVTLRSFSAGSSGFQDALGGLLDGTNSGSPGSNFQATFTVAAPPVAVGLPDFARGPSNTDALFLPSTLTNGSTFALSYTNPASSPTTGTATVTFSTSPATLQSNIQTALSSGGLATQIGIGNGGTPNSVVVVTNDVSTGANVLVTFQSALAQSTSQLLTSTTAGVHIAAATINAANNIPGSGIPIALSSGLNATSGTFTLQYNPTLLSITGVAPSTALSAISGATFTLVSNTVSGTSGTAVLSLSSPSRLSSTTTAFIMGSLLATVPLSATSSYGAKQLLHFSSEQLSGTAGPIAVTNEDAVQVVAYLGDVTNLGPFNLADASAISAVAGGVANVITQTLPGFAAFPDLDPAIIGDVSLQGLVNSTDAGAMNQQVGGTAQKTIPIAPLGLPLTPVGPDPTVSVPASLQTLPGTTVLVPVNIDTARPSGSTGMVDAILALTYDPQIFDVSAADVELGTVPEGGSGWQLKAEVNAVTGQIGIELFSSTPIQSTAGGSLVTIAMQVRAVVPAAMPPLTFVPYVDPAGGLRVYQTEVSDAQGAFVLHETVDRGEVPVEASQLTVHAAESQSTALSSAAPAGSLLPLTVVEQVIQDLALIAADWQLPMGSSFVQPGAILDVESSEQTPNGPRDLALLQAAGIAKADWLADLAWPDQTPRSDRLPLWADLLDIAELGLEAAEKNKSTP